MSRQTPRASADTFPVRIGKVKFKRRSRYRSPAAFNIKTSMLLRAVRHA